MPRIFDGDKYLKSLQKQYDQAFDATEKASTKADALAEKAEQAGAAVVAARANRDKIGSLIETISGETAVRTPVEPDENAEPGQDDVDLSEPDQVHPFSDSVSV
jgi:outer membrane translocation and assembly module TamA